MNDAEAARNLQTIRTLMERSALYRRALGPVMITVGIIGVLGALVGCLLPVDSSVGFVLLWLTAAGLAMASSFLLVRLEALRTQEPFWTPPTRRVAAAMSLPLLAGAIGTVALVLPRAGEASLVPLLPHVWAVCYGLALHAAGFFTLRGIRQLGFAFVVGGGAFGVFFFVASSALSFFGAHLQMGVSFGIMHLVAGGKLLVEERYSLT